MMKSAKLLIFHHSYAATQCGAPSVSAGQIVAPAKENHGKTVGKIMARNGEDIMGISKNWIKTHKTPF
jgi:hypothetical protein